MISFCYLVALIFVSVSSILSTCAADPILRFQRSVSYGKVDRTEIAAVLSRISTTHGFNSLLVVLNEYGESQLMRQSICLVLEESETRSYDLQELYCYHMPSSRNIDGNLTLEALDSLEPAINTVLRDRDPRKITLQVGISNYKSFTRFNLRFKRPSKNKSKGWTRVTQIKPADMDCIATELSIRCLWVPGNEDERLLENLEPRD